MVKKAFYFVSYRENPRLLVAADADIRILLRWTNITPGLKLLMFIKRSNRMPIGALPTMMRRQIGTVRSLQYYNKLIARGLINGEIQHEPLTNHSVSHRSTGNIADAAGQKMHMMHLTPDAYVGTSSFTHLPIGTKLSMMFMATGRISNVSADMLNTNSSLGLTKVYGVLTASDARIL